MFVPQVCPQVFRHKYLWGWRNRFVRGRDGEPKLEGVNVEDFGPIFGGDWLVLGGAERVGADDGKPRFVRGSFGPFRFAMHKGSGHRWTRFCEDSLFLCVREEGVVAAVFDGVSGDMDGSGGIASRAAAKILSKHAGRLFAAADLDGALEDYREECASEILVGATTAIIFVLPKGGRGRVYAKGDSLCYVDGRLVNEPESVGGMLLKVLNDDQPFSKYEVGDARVVALYSDGIFSAWDDLTEVELTLG